MHCVKSVRIRSYSGPHFSAFRLNKEIHTVPLHIQSKCGKRRTRINPNMDTLYVVMESLKITFTDFYISCIKYVNDGCQRC